jgi:plastocyanin
VGQLISPWHGASLSPAAAPKIANSELLASTLADKAFSPDEIKIKSGDSVKWTNDDAMFHTVVSGSGINDPAKGKEFDSGLSGPNALTTKGKTFTHTFTKAGEFPYFCQLHPTMVGKVVVS